MKRKIYLSLFVAILAFVGCATDPITETPVEKPDTTIDPEVITMIKEMGFSTDDIIEMEDRYIVEGDISISKEHMAKLKDEPKTRQAYMNSPIRGDLYKHISIYIHPDLNVGGSNSWSTAMTAAMSAWNSIPNCDVNFTSGTSSSYDVIFRRNLSLPYNALGSTDFFIGDEPGRFVEVGNENNYSDLDAAERKYVMVHELGHLLRLMHSDYKVTGELFGLWAHDIAGTLATDLASVMYSTWNNRSWNSNPFTAGDIKAVQVLYGPPPAKPVIVSMGGGTQRVYEPYLSRISPLRDPLIFWVLPGDYANLNVDNYERDDTTYEWQGQLGSGQTTGFGDSAIVIPTTPNSRNCYEIQCRAKRNGVYSDWTTFYLYVNTSLPN